MKYLRLIALVALLLSSSSTPARAVDQAAADLTAPASSPVDAIVAGLPDPDLRRLASEVLERNPGLAMLRAEARAAEQRAPQVGSLPDPMASLTLFLLQPQTRVGPQQAAVGISQQLPWFGKLALKEQAAMLEAAAARSRVESARLALLTRLRRLALELQYLDREQQIVTEDRSTLEHYEELAQARYASGVGLSQTVIKIQAEITRARTRLLDLDERRVSLLAEINTLRDRPDGTAVRPGTPPPVSTDLPPLDRMRQQALESRPELVRDQALIDAATARIELARKGYRPDLNLGLSYALVGRRDDPAGSINPPRGNGKDILGISAGINLPIHRKRLDAAVEEAVAQQLAAEESRRETSATITGDIADLARRIPLVREQLQLLDEVLSVQAEESLRSAETAYAAGTAGALDLLDAERVLLGVRIAAERTRTDLAVALAKLEGALATPLAVLASHGGAS